MGPHTSKEKVQRFSFRKSSWGLVSATVACLFMASPFLPQTSVAAQGSEVQVDYRYVTEAELTSQEKKLVTEALPGLAKEGDRVYYLIYRPTAQSLPKTGQNGLLASGLVLAGASLLVYAVKTGRNGKKALLGFFVLTATGAVAVSPTGLAITSQVLSHYNQIVSVSQGQELPKPLDIAGYSYLGYIEEEVASPSTGQSVEDSAKDVALPEKEGQTEEVNLPQETAATPGQETGEVVLEEEQPTTPTEEKQETKPETTPSVPSVLPVEKPVDEPVGIEPDPSKVEDVVEETPAQPVETEEEQLPPVAGDQTSPDTSGAEGVPDTASELPVEKPVDEPVGIEPDPSKAEDVVEETPSQPGTTETSPGQPEPTTPDPVAGEVTPPVQPDTTETQPVPEAPKPAPEEETPPVQPVDPGTVTEPVAPVEPNQPTEGEETPVQPVTPTVEAEPVTSKPDKSIYHSKPSLEIVETETSRLESVPFTIELVQDSSLPAGQRRTQRQGVNGQQRIRTKIYTVNGQEIKRQDLAPELITAPTKQIDHVGTGVLTVPSLTITEVRPDALGRDADLHFSLTDSSSTFRSAKAFIYKDGQKVKEVSITDPSQAVTVTGLEHFTNYQVRTEITYDIGQGNQTKLEESTKNFILELKKIEIKDVDTVELYGVEDRRYRRYLSLSARPERLEDYFVKIKSDRFKEILLPITTIEEVTVDGQEKFKLTANLEQLVQDSQTGYQENFSFYIDKVPTSQAGIYTSFKTLLTAMQNNRTGHFVIGADLTADEVQLDASATSYLTGEFKGSLTAEHNGKKYAIHHLTNPLFDTLNGATIQKLDLVDVNIKSEQDRVGALAKSAINTNLTDVAVQGEITAAANIGGVVYEASAGSKLRNTSFDGSITATNPAVALSNIGGLVGHLTGAGSQILQSQSLVDLTVSAPNPSYRTGGLVGMVTDTASVEKVYVKGKVTNFGNSGQTGGIIGSTWSNGRAKDLLADVVVTNGNLVHGDTNHVNATIQQAAVTSQARGRVDQWTSILQGPEFTSRLTSYGISAATADSQVKHEGNKYSVDYSRLSKADSNKAVAYANLEKLMPFYNKEYILEMAKHLPANHKLNSSLLVDVVPMVGEQVVTDLNSQKTAINRLMLHFADKSVAYETLRFKQDFANRQIAEYQLGNTGLIYTPESFLSAFTKPLTLLVNELSRVNFQSDEVRRVLGTDRSSVAVTIKPEDDNSSRWAMDLGVKQTDEQRPLWALYLEDSFNQVQSSIGEQLRKLLSSDKAINSVGLSVENYLIDKISKNKEAFLLGLAYLNRWYDVNYDKLNIKDLSIFKLDFFGNTEASALDTIIALGQSGYDNLRPKNNVTTFAGFLADAKAQLDLFTYLESYRQLFLPGLSNNQWFKQATRAKIEEVESGIEEVAQLQRNAEKHSKYNLGVYDRITNPKWQYRNMVLPLLTMKDPSVYVLSTMSTLSFGAFERYQFDSKDKEQTFEQYMAQKVAQAGRWQANYFDFWYRVLDKENKEKLFQSFINYDGFNFQTPNKGVTWVSLKDTQYKSIKDFFGPVGKWYSFMGSGAYATGHYTHFEVDRILDQYGSSIFTHEMVHNFDGNIYLMGHGRRVGEGAEVFSEGLLQNPTGLTSAILGINTMFTGDANATDRFHTADPTNRFKSVEDLEQYMRGMMDTVYFLDYLEANSVLKKNAKFKQDWYRQIGNWYDLDKDQKVTTALAGNSIQPLTGDIASRLNTVGDLVDNNIITRRNYWDQKDRLERNSYYTIKLFSPIYAALSNEVGAPGDIMFKRMAFELLAEKGYVHGFIPYVSNQLSQVAAEQGYKYFDNWYGREVGLVTDKIVFDHVFEKDSYQDWAAFKKAMYQRRIDQKDRLIDITIEYKLGDRYSSETVHIQTFEQLERLMNAAVDYDYANREKVEADPSHSWVNILKERVYNALLRQTNDFRTSIFE
ncbi:YSIRK-type signal peptide-containing protein [Streptococcus suis]|nr:YSIRK-type signal peptide-containing protein [Streptococcus suis]